MSESELGSRLTIRLTKRMEEQLRDLARADGVSTGAVARDLLARSLRRKTAGAAVDPLMDALHAVLPAYIRPLHDLVAAARYDAIVARELSVSSAFAAMLATGMDQSQARQVVQNTLGKAAKTASRRMRERIPGEREEAVAGGTTDPETDGGRVG